MERKRRNICVNSGRVDTSRNFLLREMAVPVTVTRMEARQKMALHRDQHVLDGNVGKK